MTVNVRLAGVGSVFLALSVARTSKLWAPGRSGAEGVWLAPGPEQAAKGWELKRHLKVEPAWLEAKVNVGVRSKVGPEGPAVIVVWGATVSTVKDRDTTALSFPGASIALAKKVWAPSKSGEPPVNGEAQALKEAASKRHAKVEPGSVEAKEKLGVESLMKLPWPGPEAMLAWGGIVSAVKPRKVG
jgi:hypothetical protein